MDIEKKQIGKKEFLRKFILFVKKENGEDYKELSESENDWINLFLTNNQ